MTATSAPYATRPPRPLSPDATSEQQDAGTLGVANAALRGGFVLLPRTLLHAPGLSRDAKLLYAVLLSYAWQQGSCFPGAARLQHDLGCGKNQVTRYLQELEEAGLVSRRRRGQGKTTVYTLHDPPAPAASPTPSDQPVVRRSAPDAPEQGTRSPRTGEARLPKSGNQDAPKQGAEYDSAEEDPEEHQPPVVHAPPPARALPPLAPTNAPVQQPPGAVDDDALELLISHGVTRRIAQDLVKTHPAEAIRQQVAWQGYRPQATSPAGALVQAVRDAWPPPPAWLVAQEHTATVARQAGEERQRQEEAKARRREWEAKLPEERIAGRLQFWLLGRRRKGWEPAAGEVEAKRVELLAELAAAGGVS